jgi:hypothetical protein
MTPKRALAFVEKNGVVLESARGPAPNLAEIIAGETIRGSWWAHPKSSQIFRCTRALRDSSDLLVCRLLGGKVTYVHRRLWPALVKLHERFEPRRLAAIRETHTAQGKHETTAIAFPKWVPPDVVAEAASLTTEQAVTMLRTDGLKLKAASGTAA